MIRYFAAAASSMLLAGTASAAIVVDGTLDADYGTPTATVTYDQNALEGNFGGAPTDPQPSNTTNRSSYDIYVRSDANFFYGFFRAAGDQPIEATFANLYFDLNPTVGDGSDIGFELSPGRTSFFLPGTPGTQDRFDILRAAANGGLDFEVAIPLAYFTGTAAGITYYPGQTFEASQTLRLSQTFGYSVAGGPGYGPNRLGAFAVSAEAGVPEPATWATMLGGFALLGAAARRRRARAGVRFA